MNMVFALFGAAAPTGLVFGAVSSTMFCATIVVALGLLDAGVGLYRNDDAGCNGDTCG